MTPHLETELLAYFDQYKILKEKGGPEHDSGLFEEVLAKEENILAAFGLPESLKYLQILHELVSLPHVGKAELEQTVQQLQSEAEHYHSRPVISSLETLALAQQNKINAFDVLPELGYITHTYSIFVYEELLLKEGLAPHDVLQELVTVHEQDLYEPIGKLKFNLSAGYRRTKRYKELKEKLQFIDQFLAQENGSETNSAEVLPEDQLLALLNASAATAPGQEPDHSFGFSPEYLLLTDVLELEEIMFSPDSGVTLTGLLKQNPTPARVSLGLEMDQLLQILPTYSAVGRQVIDLLKQHPHTRTEDEPVVLLLKDKLGSSLALDQHYFKVYKPVGLDREGNPELLQEAFYLVEEILKKVAFDQLQVREAKNMLGYHFQKLRKRYKGYLQAKGAGASDKAARKANSLTDNVRFELARLLYQLDLYGGSLR